MRFLVFLLLECVM